MKLDFNNIKSQLDKFLEQSFKEGIPLLAKWKLEPEVFTPIDEWGTIKENIKKLDKDKFLKYATSQIIDRKEAFLSFGVDNESIKTEVQKLTAKFSKESYWYQPLENSEREPISLEDFKFIERHPISQKDSVLELVLYDGNTTYYDLRPYTAMYIDIDLVLWLDNLKEKQTPITNTNITSNEVKNETILDEPDYFRELFLSPKKHIPIIYEGLKNHNLLTEENKIERKSASKAYGVVHAIHEVSGIIDISSFSKPEVFRRFDKRFQIGYESKRNNNVPEAKNKPFTLSKRNFKHYLEKNISD